MHQGEEDLPDFGDQSALAALVDFFFTDFDVGL